MNVLINAFAIGPHVGSEPGIGWWWITHIAKHCKVFVICGDEYRNDVDSELNKLPQKDNIVLNYNPIPQKVIKMVRNQGDWRFYYYYKKWQKKAYQIALKICSENQIDIIHQLNLTTYREPGYLWKINGPKYVWGPVGGMILCPIEYIKTIDSKTTWKYRIKNFLNNLQLRIEPRVRKAANHSDLVFFDSNTGVKNFNKIFGKKGIQINETGCVVRGTSNRLKVAGSGDYLDILWVGRFLPTKLLDLAFKTISKIDSQKRILLHILGTGELEGKYKEIAREYGVEDRLKWYGQVSHDEVEQIMRSSDLFFFTSVVEGTPSVIMECISNGLPILCFDTCGFGPIVDETIGIKINLSNPERSASEFAEKINLLYDHRELLKDMSNNCALKINSISWDALIDRLLDNYKGLLTNKSNQ